MIGDLRRALRRRHVGTEEREAGFTLVEMLVAMSIGIGIIALTLASITTGLFSQANGVAFGQATNEATLAISQLQQSVVNATVVFNPATEGANAGSGIPAGFSLRILTSVAGSTTCMQWRVTGINLEYRSWLSGTTRHDPGWKTLFGGIMNDTQTPPFSLATTTAYGKRLLNVNLAINATDKGSSTTDVKVSFVAIDAEFAPSTSTSLCPPPS